MTDEEKKAIENIKDFKNLKWYEHAFDNGTEVLDEEQKQDIGVVLNLIEKQSKEIEELKEKNKELYNPSDMILRYYDNGKEMKVEIKGFISIDKIKAKTEEAKKNYNDLHTKHLRDCGIAEQRELAKIEFGQSLLEKE